MPGANGVPFILNNHHQAHGDAAVAGDDTYQGATVIEPAAGWYEDNPVIVVDFASLYPSIMIAHNICLSTLVRRDEDVGRPGIEHHAVSGKDVHFTTKNVGVLPAMLEELLTARKCAKRRWGGSKRCIRASPPPMRPTTSTHPTEGAKVSHDSSRCSTSGSWRSRSRAMPSTASRARRQGGFYDLDVASTTTAKGREMLSESTDAATEFAASLKRADDGEAVGEVKLVYGDTDSLMFTLSSCTRPRTPPRRASPSHSTSPPQSSTRAVTSKRSSSSKRSSTAPALHEEALLRRQVRDGRRWQGRLRRDQSQRHGQQASRDSCKFVHKIYDAMIDPLPPAQGSRRRDSRLPREHVHARDRPRGVRRPGHHQVGEEQLQATVGGAAQGHREARAPSTAAAPDLAIAWRSSSCSARRCQRHRARRRRQIRRRQRAALRRLLLRRETVQDALRVHPAAHPPNPTALIDGYLAEARRVRTKAGTIDAFCNAAPSSAISRVTAASSAAPPPKKAACGRERQHRSLAAGANERR